MHYEEELDLLCRCIRANISIILHKTVYEINSTLLLRTHFKPPSSVCNNFYDKMHYEEELDLLCRCIRASISIILHKTVYEINSTLLLRTHFKPPSSVCNNFSDHIYIYIYIYIQSGP